MKTRLVKLMVFATNPYSKVEARKVFQNMSTTGGATVPT
jgi:hypothetical protein